MSKRRREDDFFEFPPPKRPVLVLRKETSDDDWTKVGWKSNEPDLLYGNNLSPIEPPDEDGDEDEIENEEDDLIGDIPITEDIDDDDDYDDDDGSYESPPAGLPFKIRRSPYSPQFEDSIPDEVYKQVEDEYRAKRIEYNTRKNLFDTSYSSSES